MNQSGHKGCMQIEPKVTKTPTTKIACISRSNMKQYKKVDQKLFSQKDVFRSNLKDNFAREKMYSHIYSSNTFSLGNIYFYASDITHSFSDLHTLIIKIFTLHETYTFTFTIGKN